MILILSPTTVNGIPVTPFPSISVRFVFIVIGVLFRHFHLPCLRLLSPHTLLYGYLRVGTWFYIFFFFKYFSSLFWDFSIFNRPAFFNIFRLSIFSPSSPLPIFSYLTVQPSSTFFGYQFFHRPALFQNFILFLKYLTLRMVLSAHTSVEWIYFYSTVSTLLYWIILDFPYIYRCGTNPTLLRCSTE